MNARIALATATLVAMALTVGLAVSAAATNTAYYVDCSAGSNGSGTQSSPWNSLASVNSKSGGFSSGDQILLKRATTCNGVLNPAGSGTSGNPIVLDAYGSGALPKIVATSSNVYALKLSDQSYWTIRNLDVSGSSRYGVFVTVTTGVVNGITITDLNVHDVNGGILDEKDTGLVIVSPTSDPTNTTSARFNNVLIDRVIAHDTNMWAGILIGDGDGDVAFDSAKRSTNVTIKNSTAYNIYGDGIVLWTVNNGLLDHNVAHHTGIQPTYTIGTPNAIWTFGCDGCTVQYNEAYLNDSPAWDGGAFDIDYFSTNTIVQYNYAHDNSTYCIGLFAAENYVTRNTTIRYNVCANNGTSAEYDRQEMQFYTNSGGSIDGLAIYNNTFITSHGVMKWSATFSGSLPLIFKNNLVYSTTSEVWAPLSVFTSDYNLWYYTGGSWSVNEPHSVFANPQLINASHTGNGAPGAAFTLGSGSPAIDAGVAISGSGSNDFYGNSIPQGNAVDIGSGESSFTSGGNPELLSNSGFESGNLSGWGLTSVSVTSTTPRTGTYAANIVGSSSEIYRTVTGLSPNTTYAYSVWAKADAGNTGYLYADGYGGSEVDSGTINSTSYSPVTLVFTTGATNTSVNIGLWRGAGTGTGNVEIDDASLKKATFSSSLGNGGFESGSLTPWGTWPSGGTVGASNAHSGTYAGSISGSSAEISQSLSGLSPNTSYVLTAWVKAAAAGNQGILYAQPAGGTEVVSYVVTSTSYVPVSIAFTTGSGTTADIGIWRAAGSGIGLLYVDDVTLVSR